MMRDIDGALKGSGAQVRLGVLASKKDPPHLVEFPSASLSGIDLRM